MKFNPTFKKALLVSALVIVLAAVTLLVMGRLPVCKCGVISLWSGNIYSNQNSQQVADPYTFTHILHGTGFYLLLWLVGRKFPAGARLVAAVILESGWEVLENTDFVINRYREATISLDYYGDSVLNSVSDIWTMVLGFYLAYKLPVKVTIVGSILLDALLLILIRDSLFLNIVMLIHPFDFIREWQTRI